MPQEAGKRSLIEDELRRSEERFRTLIENSSDAIAVLNTDGTLRYESPSMSRLLGYDPESTMGKTSFELVHPDDMPSVMEGLSKLLQNPGGSTQLDVRVRHKDGSWRTLEVVARNLLDDPAVEGIVINQRDITERRQAEELIRRSEERYRLLAENVSDVIWTMDMNLKYTYVSPSVERLRGYSIEEVMTQGIQASVASQSLEVSLNAFAEELAIEEVETKDITRTRTLELELNCKDGSTIWTEVKMSFLRDQDGRPLGILGITRDITERRKAEEALREAERRYKVIFDNRLQMVYVINEMGVFLDANDCALERLGYTRDDLGKISMVDVLHPDDLTKALESKSKIQATGYQEHSLEFRLITKSGETIYVVVFGIPLEQGDSHGSAICIADDITESKRTEAQLRESENKLMRYLDSSPDAIYISDSSAIFRYGNRAAEKIVGYSREELIGKSFLELDLLPSEYLQKAAQLHEINKAGKPTGPDEFELTRKDGSCVFVEISTYPMGEGDNIEVIGIARDITERKKIEKALRESEERLRALIENAPESISAYELDGTIIDVNRKGEELLGYSRDELVGRNMLNIGVIPEDHVSRTNKALAENAWDFSGRPFEFELIRRDGSRICVEATTITVERGGRTQIICISRDITERKQMEQQLHLAGRLAAVGQLAAGVAHELNNPLTAVQGFAQFLAQRSNVDADTREDLETIYREAQRATRITGNLLSFARKYKPEKKLISINEALEKSLELHAYRMRVNNVEVVIQLDPDLPETMTDFHQMQQVFVNIVTNAEQAMTEVHRKGTLVVKTENVGGMIRVTFADDGPGIPNDILKSVFDPFFTTKEVGSGTGLGLSICYGIVREHGGRLYAKSARGKGATFVVEIPIISEDRIDAGGINSTHLFHAAPEQT